MLKKCRLVFLKQLSSSAADQVSSKVLKEKTTLRQRRCGFKTFLGFGFFWGEEVC